MNRMKQQFNNRKTTIQEHFGHVESLRDEISAVMDKKAELENQIRSLSEERTNLTETLEQSSENIRKLERKQKDQDQLVRSKEKYIEELRAGNQHLLERLETMSRSRSSSPSCSLSLLSEIEMSGSDHEKKDLNHKHFEVIEETDEEFYFDDMENSESEAFDDEDYDADMKGLKNEVRLDMLGNVAKTEILIYKLPNNWNSCILFTSYYEKICKKNDLILNN